MPFAMKLGPKIRGPLDTRVRQNTSQKRSNDATQDDFNWTSCRSGF